MWGGGLPSRYIHVEYIESHGTEWIDTGWKVLSTMASAEVYIEFTPLENENQSCPCGAWGNGASPWQFTPWNNQIYHGTGNNSVAINRSAGTRMSLDMYSAGTYLEVGKNGAQILSANNISWAFDFATFAIFCEKGINGAASYLSKQKVHAFKILENSTLVRDFIPVLDTQTNKYGLYDLVTQQFFGNQGTGDFSGGGIYRPIQHLQKIIQRYLIHLLKFNFL